MLESFELDFGGKTYEWQYEPSTQAVDQCWRWIDLKTGLVPPGQISERLCALSLERISEMRTGLTPVELKRVDAILESMGLSPSQKRAQSDDCAESNDSARQNVPFSAPAESPLHALGYKVGNDGLGPARRQAILIQAFEGQLPSTASAAYMAEWGEPRSAVRRDRIIFHLESILQIAIGNPRMSVKAKDDWQADLRWIRDNLATCFRVDTIHTGETKPSRV